MLNLVIFLWLFAFSVMAESVSLSGEVRFFDPSFSARFLPMSITFSDSSEKSKFKQAFSLIPRDSVAHMHERGGKLTISRTLMCRLLEKETDLSLAPISQFTRFFIHKYNLTIAFPRFSAKGFIPTDPLFYPYQWNLLNSGQNVYEKAGIPGKDIDITTVWEQFSGHDSLVIAVVDAGVNLFHDDLKNRIWRNPGEYGGKPGVDDDGNGLVDDTIGWDFVENDASPMDYDGHGTTIASVIASNGDNNEGIAGILGRGKIMPIRVLSASGSGEEDAIAKGVQYAVDLKADVINMSIGGDLGRGPIRQAFAEAEKHNIPIVISAGNESVNVDSNPIFQDSPSYQNIYTVASHNHLGELSNFSNYGAKTVDFAAPGEAVAAATIPAKILVFQEGFENGLDNWDVYRSGDFSISDSSPIDSNLSLEWQSGGNTFFATKDFIDLSGKVGAVLAFRLDYSPDNFWDALVVEGTRSGSDTWEEISVIPARIPPDRPLSFPLISFEGAKFKLRFRTLYRSRFIFYRLVRTLKVDDITVRVCDPAPDSYNNYSLVAGTSIAAPHVAAYLGMLRLACDRMGRVLDRQTALAGTVAEPALQGKVLNGGRLDIAKGLGFYLKTLPKIVIEDSVKKDWTSEDTVIYRAMLNGGEPQQYALKLVEDNSRRGSIFQGNTFTFLKPDSGSYQLDFQGEGPTLLRYRLGFQVSSSVKTIFASRPVPASFFWWNGVRYLLPTDAMPGDIIQIKGFNAAGRLCQTLLVKPTEASNRRQSGDAGGVSLFYRLSVNGNTLLRAP